MKLLMKQLWTDPITIMDTQARNQVNQKIQQQIIEQVFFQVRANVAENLEWHITKQLYQIQWKINAIAFHKH